MRTRAPVAPSLWRRLPQSTGQRQERQIIAKAAGNVFHIRLSRLARVVSQTRTLVPGEVISIVSGLAHHEWAFARGSGAVPATQAARTGMDRDIPLRLQ